MVILDSILFSNALLASILVRLACKRTNDSAYVRTLRSITSELAEIHRPIDSPLYNKTDECRWCFTKTVRYTVAIAMQSLYHSETLFPLISLFNRIEKKRKVIGISINTLSFAISTRFDSASQIMIPDLLL